MIGRFQAPPLRFACAAAFVISSLYTLELGDLSAAEPPPRLQPDAAQGEDGLWNSPRVRELLARAIARRRAWTGEGRIGDYRAQARGHIYFLYDLGRDTERNLVRADQLALELYWRAPDQTRQVIVGQRQKKVLPTSIRYHLDHLTVVMDNFGDLIRLGEGSEVEDALHPAARGALDYYDYQLSDSLVLELPDREIRVYEVRVRPRDASTAGLVGVMYLDRASADIVRMEFTFTAVSYLDTSLDYINIRLENALWEGAYWLPRRQGIELRREYEFLDFPAGGIIRAEFRIGDYDFNTGTPESFFRGPSVIARPARARERFEFDEGLYAALDPTVATTPPSLEAIRERAGRIVSERYLERLRGPQLAVPGASSILRFRRAEGLYLGPGVSHGFPGGIDLMLLGGYAIGRDRWQAEARIGAQLGADFDLRVAGYRERAADVAPWPRSSGVVATLAALLAGEDYREPYWASGGRLTLGRSWASARARLSLAWESWEPAALEADAVLDRSLRAVRELDEGEVAWLALELERPPVGALEAVGGLTWAARIEGATRTAAGDFDYLQLAFRGSGFWPDLAASVDLLVSGEAGAVGGGGVPAQRLFPAGGRGTARGYAFNRFVGNLYGGLGLELRREIRDPFVSFGLFSDVVWVGVEGAAVAEAVERWNRAGRVAGSTRGPLIGVGAGFGLLFDILRIELARGLRGGGIWELVVRVRPEFWGWL